jgi:hypothetical protein
VEWWSHTAVKVLCATEVFILKWYMNLSSIENKMKRCAPDPSPYMRETAYES